MQTVIGCPQLGHEGWHFTIGQRRHVLLAVLRQRWQAQFQIAFPECGVFPVAVVVGLGPIQHLLDPLTQAQR